MLEGILLPSNMAAKTYTAKQSGFFSKSVKKSVKRGVRVLRARSARASHMLSVFSLIPDLLFDCSRVLEYAKIRPVLQSSQNYFLLITC